MMEDARAALVEDSRRTHSGMENHDGDTEERFGHPVCGSIPTIVRSYKASVTWRLNRLRECPGHPVWQRNYYEHVVRDEADWERIATYILENPRLWHEDRSNPSRVKDQP